MTFVRKIPLIVFVSLCMMEKQAFASKEISIYSEYSNAITQSELEEQNKDIVLTAISVLTNPDTNIALELLPNYFSEDYIQHNPFTPNGLDAARNFFILNRPDGLTFEPSIALGEGNFVVSYGRFDTSLQARPTIAIDIFRIENSKIVEHWDVLEDEKFPGETASGNGMYPILPSSNPLGFPKFFKANNTAKTFFHKSIEARNKAIVTIALNALFNQANHSVLSAFWDENLIQHNPNIANGLNALMTYYQSAEVTYEAGFILADDDFVFTQNRLTGVGPSPVIVAQFFRLEQGKIVEQWENTQVEIPADNTASGNPMFPIELTMW